MTTLRLLQYSLWIVGACAIGYCTFVLSDAAITQAHLARAFDRARTVNNQSTPLVPAGKPVVFTPVTPYLFSREPSTLGRLEIARIGMSAMILEGDGSASLRLGLGHISGTAKPGEPGNAAIAGHRDTFFRPLHRIRPGDQIVLDTVAGKYHYSVSATEIVDPTDTRVLRSDGQNELTLVTCYPFDYLGRAPKRFIVHAVLAD